MITVDANYDNRIFDIGGFYRPSTPVRIGGLKLRAGDAQRDGGAIRNWTGNGGYAASLTVDNVVITDSYAEDDGGGDLPRRARRRSLTITNSRIVDNRAGAYEEQARRRRRGGVFTNGSSVTISRIADQRERRQWRRRRPLAEVRVGRRNHAAAVQITGSEINNNRALGMSRRVRQEPPRRLWRRRASSGSR